MHSTNTKWPYYNKHWYIFKKFGEQVIVANNFLSSNFITNHRFISVRTPRLTTSLWVKSCLVTRCLVSKSFIATEPWDWVLSHLICWSIRQARIIQDYFSMFKSICLISCPYLASSFHQTFLLLFSVRNWEPSGTFRTGAGLTRPTWADFGRWLIVKILHWTCEVIRKSGSSSRCESLRGRPTLIWSVDPPSRGWGWPNAAGVTLHTDTLF